MSAYSSDNRGAAASGRFWRPDNAALWAIAFAVIFAVLAIRLGTDASWDFRNYHFYNGFSVFHDRAGLDILPAQSQTALYKGLDGVYYLLFAALNNHPWALAAVLSLPYAGAAVAVFLIARLFVEAGPFWRGSIAAAAALIGLMGVASFSTLASTMSDVTPGLPLLAGLAFWLRLERAGRNGIGSALFFGLLAGASVGLKLTQAPLFVGLSVAILARTLWRGRVGLLETIAFGAAGVAAFAALDAGWLLGNWRAYGDPVFPLRNDLFRSDLIAPEPWTDLRFMPKTLAQALFYPAYWAFRPVTLVAEMPMRDPRILTGAVASLAILAAGAARKMRGSKRPPTEGVALFLAIAFLVAVVLWEKSASIYRYLAVEEALSVVLALAALTLIARNRTWIALVLFAFVGFFLVRETQGVSWGRVKGEPAAVSVKLPPIEPDAMFLILDWSPLGYVAAFLPETARTIGVDNNLVHPGSPGRLAAMIAAAVEAHRGPLWGVEDPTESPGKADAALAALGLAREGCEALDSNLEFGRTARICRLKRTVAVAPAAPSR